MSDLIDNIIARHIAASRALHAEARARREAFHAAHPAPAAKAVPAVITGPLAPIEDYFESVRRGWSTD